MGNRSRIKGSAENFESQAIFHNGELNSEMYNDVVGSSVKDISDILDTPTSADYKAHRQSMKTYDEPLSYKRPKSNIQVTSSRRGGRNANKHNIPRRRAA